jgi:hypothetical protein
MANLATIDLDTGAILDGVLVHMPQRKTMGRDYVMMFQDTFMDLAANRALTGEHFRVLLYLLSKVGFNNQIVITQKDAANTLGIPQSSISRDLKGLVEQKVLLHGPKIGNSRTFVLSPSYGWRGDAGDYHDAMNKHLASYVCPPSSMPWNLPLPPTKVQYPPIVPA